TLHLSLRFLFLFITLLPPRSTLFPYTTLFRSMLFDEISAQVGDRPGGYTRVVRLGRRAGDGAPLAVIELVDYNDVQPDTGSGGKRRTRRGGGRGRRGGRPKGTAAVEEQQTKTSAKKKQAETDQEVEQA